MKGRGEMYPEQCGRINSTTTTTTTTTSSNSSNSNSTHPFVFLHKIIVNRDDSLGCMIQAYQLNW